MYLYVSPVMISEPGVVDQIIRHLELTFAAEGSGEYE